MQYDIPLDIPTVSITCTKRRRRAKPASSRTEMTCRQLRIERRNRVMVARYYYWTEIRRRRFDDVMRILSEEEFFVEERTISNALLDFDVYLNGLYSAKCDAKELRREYPNWNWDNN